MAQHDLVGAPVVGHHATPALGLVLDRNADQQGSNGLPDCIKRLEAEQALATVVPGHDDAGLVDEKGRIRGRKGHEHAGRL